MFTRLKRLSPWRKLSLVTWGPAGDPSVYGQYDFDATNALKFIEEYNNKNETKITLTHYVSKAIALALAESPTLNGIIKWGNIYLRDSVDIFLQVSIDNKDKHHTEHLSGAKIKSVDKKSLKEISEELQNKANRIRNDDDPQFQKTFNITRFIPVLLLKPLVRINEFLIYNIGLHIPSLGLIRDPFGSAMLTSVGSLNAPPGFAPLVPPSRCPFLVCLGRIEKKPWVVDDRIEIRPVVSFTVTFDHRFIDGLSGAKLFHRFIDVVYNPSKYMD